MSDRTRHRGRLTTPPPSTALLRPAYPASTKDGHGRGHRMRRKGFLTLVGLCILAVAAPAASASAPDKAHLASISVSASRLKVGGTFTVTAQATNPSGEEYGVGFWFDPQVSLVGETCSFGVSPDTPECEYGIGVTTPTATVGTFQVAEGATSFAIKVCVLPHDSTVDETCRSTRVLTVK